MKQFLSTFVITLVVMFVLALIVHGFVCQSDKIEELEKRIAALEQEKEGMEHL